MTRRGGYWGTPPYDRLPDDAVGRPLEPPSDPPDEQCPHCRQWVDELVEASPAGEGATGESRICAECEYQATRYFCGDCGGPLPPETAPVAPGSCGDVCGTCGAILDTPWDSVATQHPATAARRIRVLEWIRAELSAQSSTRAAIIAATQGQRVTPEALRTAADWIDCGDRRSEVQLPSPREAARLRRLANALEEVES